MRGMRPTLLAMLICLPANAQQLSGSQLLSTQGDLALQMVDGIGRYLDREAARSVAFRERMWQFYTGSTEDARAAQRYHLREILGIERNPESSNLKVIQSGDPGDSAEIAKGRGYKVYQVRWQAGEGLETYGLWLAAQNPRMSIIAIPDCANTPEQLAGLEPGIPSESQVARRLAENRCNVLVPLLLNRESSLSRLGQRATDIPHREFVYRAAFELGRTLLGLEVQSLLAVKSWLHAKGLPTGVFGYGEGGRIALHVAAITGYTAVVSGYFQPREALWSEPIDRNLFGILNRLGDAELALMSGKLIVETSNHPEWKMEGQSARHNGRAAPGEIRTPSLDDVKRETARLSMTDNPIRLLPGVGPLNGPGSNEALASLIGLTIRNDSGEIPRQLNVFEPLSVDRLFQNYVDHTQRLLRDASGARTAFWTRGASTKQLRDHFWTKVIGKLPEPRVPLNPRSRPIYDEPKYRGYEVTVDVFPDVFAHGILLVPKDIKDGERRPVVVCQHGLEGRPSDVADPKLDHPAYHRFACRLAERGFVVFAPQNPYIGGDRFRVLQRKANPLGLSLFSFITSQHQRILEWLGSLPFVDSKRIGFYGLSYGGKTAMRVPALLEGYCLSICSADYNEWIWKNASATSPYSYLFTNEYEMPEWNLGNTFNYAEMSWLIAPRPFMVERGHHDGVAPDEWVAYEYARTRRKYLELGIGDRTEIEFFNGPHTINGVGTFNFLHKHLNWPEPKAK